MEDEGGTREEEESEIRGKNCSSEKNNRKKGKKWKTKDGKWRRKKVQ